MHTLMKLVWTMKLIEKLKTNKYVDIDVIPHEILKLEDVTQVILICFSKCFNLAKVPSISLNVVTRYNYLGIILKECLECEERFQLTDGIQNRDICFYLGMHMFMAIVALK